MSGKNDLLNIVH